MMPARDHYSAGNMEEIHNDFDEEESSEEEEESDDEGESDDEFEDEEDDIESEDHEDYREPEKDSKRRRRLILFGGISLFCLFLVLTIPIILGRTLRGGNDDDTLKNQPEASVAAPSSAPITPPITSPIAAPVTTSPITPSTTAPTTPSTTTAKTTAPSPFVKDSGSNTPVPTAGAIVLTVPPATSSPVDDPVTEVSCLSEPCGLFASCWDLGDEEVVCQCDSDGTQVDYQEACPVGTCQQDRILDAVAQACVCPPERPEEDSEGFCFAASSPCLDDPCGGIGSVCTNDSTYAEGYSCRCSDGSRVSGTEDCDFATITSCDPPNPCGFLAYCYEEENAEGITSIGCECEDGTEVGLGVECPED